MDGKEEGPDTGQPSARTLLLAETIAGTSPPPDVLISASAKDYYGDRVDAALDEQSPAGSDFLAGVTRRWEAATGPASDSGIRVVNLRFGMVLGTGGGALAKMLPPFKLGLGGRLGSGRQYMSWVSLEDAIRAIHHCLVTPGLRGPMNVAAPGTVTNAEFTRSLGRALSRPTLLPVPALALRVVFGEMADILLSSARLDASKLLDTGFEFSHPDLDIALKALSKRP